MAANDLTTLSDVKAWLGRTDTNSDALLASLITRASRQIYSWLQRPLLLPHAVSESREGGRVLVLREWPVLAISSLTIDGIAIPQASSSTSGWSLDAWNGVPPGRQQTVSLRDHARSPVHIAYQSGYQITAEPQIVGGGTASVAAPFGAWAADAGVAYENGARLTPVAASPAIGQYALGLIPGQYVFNAGDDGAALLISYGFVPSDLADACIELVSERYKYSQRIGEKTHSLGGNETVSFDATRLTPLIVSLLAPYRQVSPL
jgi:hypothetical protein